MDINIESQIVVQTAAQWAVDATVYSAKRILVTSDVFWTGTTDARKFKIADGVQTWANIDYPPIGTTTTPTLAQVLTAGNLTGEQVISSDDGDSDIFIGDGGEITLRVLTTILQLTGGNLGLTSGDLQLSGETASRILSTDANSKVKALSTATYPSLAELAYVKGVTSAIQTQIDSKSPIASPTFTGTVTTPAIILSSETASTIASFDGSKNIKSLALATYPSLTELSYGKGVTSAIQTQLDSRGYTLQGSCTSITTVNDAITYYFADANIGNSTSADVVAMPIPKTAILKKAVIYAKVAGTLGSAETSTMYFRLNTATDITLSSAITLTATTQTFTSGALSQAVTIGDIFQFKFLGATFATNPQTVSFTVSLFFEYA